MYVNLRIGGWEGDVYIVNTVLPIVRSSMCLMINVANTSPPHGPWAAFLLTMCTTVSNGDGQFRNSNDGKRLVTNRLFCNLML